MADDSLNWTPGNWGKGYVEPTDGSVVEWNVDEQYGGPHHAEMAVGDMSETPRVHQDFSAFDISPVGTVDFSYLWPPSSKEKQRIFDADPRLVSKDDLEDDDDWSFAASVEPVKVIESQIPGRPYKANGRFDYGWRRSTLYDPGENAVYVSQPGVHHHEIGEEFGQPKPGVFRIRGWMADPSIDPKEMGVPLDLQGRPIGQWANRYGGFFPPEAEQALMDKYWPNWQGQPRQFSFSKTADAAFATELKLWLDEVSQHLQPKDAPTPHHDDASQMIPQFMGAKHKKHPVKEPRELEPAKTQYEQAKRDWYNRDDGWGTPLHFPFYPEPWRKDHHAPTVELAHVEAQDHPSVRLRDQDRDRVRAHVPNMPVMQDASLSSQRQRRNGDLQVRDRGPYNASSQSIEQSQELHRASSKEAADRTQEEQASELPQVNWLGPARMEGDHSFWYVPRNNTIYIGSPEYHHEQLGEHFGILGEWQESQSGLERWPSEDEAAQGSVHDDHINMDTRVSPETEQMITRALGLPTEEWRF